MHANKPPNDALLTQAAELRAGGATWDAVARAIHRAPGTVSRWPREYADRWQIALRDAEQQLVCEAAAESVLVLRKLLRSDDEKVRRDAAKSLTDLRLDLTKFDLTSDSAAHSFTSEATRLIAFLDGHTDDELAQFAANVFPASASSASLPAEPCPVDGAA